MIGVRSKTQESAEERIYVKPEKTGRGSRFHWERRLEMIDLHVESAANSLLDYITEGIENITEKPWLKTAVCSHLRRLLMVRTKNPIVITEKESYELYEKWISRKEC